MPSTCSDIEYKVNAVNCGVCPNVTQNTSVTCEVRDTFSGNCTLSVETIVCGFQNSSENGSDPVTVILKGVATN